MPIPDLTVFSPGVGVIPSDWMNTVVQGASFVSNLRSFSGLANMTVYIIGTTAPNDGGQGTFYWSNVTGTDDNGVTTVVPYGVTSGCWIRNPNVTVQTISGVANVTNIASLRALSSAPSVVWVQGYTTAGDGGEGMFFLGSAGGDNGGTVIVSAGGTYRRETGGLPYSVRWFGATGNGSTDDTASIQSCLNAAVSAVWPVFVPAGTYLVSATLTWNNANVSLYLRGAGRQDTTIKSTSTSADVIDITAFYCEVTDLTFTSSVTRTAGNHILSTCTNAIYQRLQLDKYFVGLNGVDGNGTVRDVVFSGAIATSGIGFFVNGYAAGLVVDACLWGYNTGQPYAGMQIVACGSLLMTNCDVIEQGLGILVNPTTGTVQAIQFVNVQVDTCTSGCWYISPSGTATVRAVMFSNCWAASSPSGSNVVLTATGGGVLTGVTLDNCTIINSATGNGLAVVSTSVTNVVVNGGLYSANFLSGIVFVAGCTDFSVVNVSAGQSAASLVGNGQYGIAVATGASNRYIIAQNRTTGNGVGGVSDLGSGSDKFVGNNIT